MERGVIDAYYYMQSLDTKLHASSLYWPDRHWSFVMVPDAKRASDFVSDSAVDIDRRAACWFFFTFYPKVPTEQPGTVYLAPIADSNGRPVEAGKTYKLKVLKDIPAGPRYHFVPRGAAPSSCGYSRFLPWLKHTRYGELGSFPWRAWRGHRRLDPDLLLHPLAGQGEAGHDNPMRCPLMYNIEMDPHEDLVVGGMFGWAIGPALEEVEKYYASLKKYPNPRAPDITKFANPTG